MNTNPPNAPPPEPIADFVEEETTVAGYANAEEFMHAVMTDPAKRKAKERLEELLLEGINSGPAAPMTAEDWVEIRLKAMEQLAAERAK